MLEITAEIVSSRRLCILTALLHGLSRLHPHLSFTLININYFRIKKGVFVDIFWLLA